jgi:hypothetical protein
MQTEILDADPDVTESPEPTEEKRRTDRNEEVLTAIQQNLLRRSGQRLPPLLPGRGSRRW